MPPRDTAAQASGSRGLPDGFLRSAERFAERPALEVDGEALSYAQLREQAAGLAATIAAVRTQAAEPVAIYAYRSVPAFSGILGTLLAGSPYVPLNPTLAVARNRLMLERAGGHVLVADAASAPSLPELLEGVTGRCTVIVPDLADPRELAGALAGHAVLGAADLRPPEAWTAPAADPEAVAYILFTSGSTGIPKGVTVAHRNVTWLLDTMTERYGLTEHDRVSQTHELTFDVSVWDMFVTWECGACLCCPTQRELIAPGRFIRDSGLTVWFSVPSTAILMRRLGQLKPGAYPGLRYSLFAGEPLPAAVAEDWRQAAPASTVENLYGPTELTIVCLGHRWGPGSAQACENGTVPIGEPLRGNRPLVLDPSLREVPAGSDGELVIGGPQVTQGYWGDPERTAAGFVSIPGHEGRYYRTGDRVRRPAPGAPMTYLGRLDHQVKVRGVRVELGEVEAVLREETGSDAVVALAWPLTETGADGIVAFVGGAEFDRADLLARLRSRLLAQMVPREIRALAELPLNGSGKFDRPALRASLESERQAAA